MQRSPVTANYNFFHKQKASFYGELSVCAVNWKGDAPRMQQAVLKLDSFQLMDTAGHLSPLLHSKEG